MAKKKTTIVTKMVIPASDNKMVRRQFGMHEGVLSRLLRVSKEEGRPFSALVEHVASALAFGEIDLRDLRPLGQYRKMANKPQVPDSFELED